MARLQVLLAAVLFGTTGTAQALGPEGLTPLTVGAARIVIGGASLALIAAVAGELRGRWPRGQLALAASGVAVYQLAFFEAVDRTGVAVGTIVAIGSGPIAAGLLERLLDGVWPSRAWALATALAAGGVVALTLASTGEASIALDGVVLALVAGSAYAGYTVLAKRLIRAGHGSTGVMGASFGLAAVMLAPVLVFGDTAWLQGAGGIGLAVYLGLLPTAVAYVLFARGLRSLSASEVTTTVLAEPLTATLLGVLVLDERLGALGVVGAGLVLGGLVVLGAAPSGRTPSPVAAEAPFDDIGRRDSYSRP